MWSPSNQEESSQLLTFIQESGLSPITATVLWRRGIRSIDAYEDLVSPDVLLSQPGDLPDMQACLEGIRQARRDNQRVRIYGDYDADGVTATAVMFEGLRAYGIQNLDYYIPNRFDEGYGLNREAVQKAADDGISWLITVDCGSSSPDSAKLAQSLGIELIITDHHGLPATWPVARALVNPERMQIPNRFSGAGVALQVIRGLLKESTPPWCVAVAAIGTVADVVPLRGDNRRLVAQGLQILRSGAVAGVNALMASKRRDVSTIGAVDLGFLIGPHLNAAGRMGDAHLAVSLLLSTQQDDSDRLAGELVTLNQQRRTIEQNTTSEAFDQLAEDQARGLNPFVVVAGDGWHHGVIGIVASRLKEALRRPVAVIGWEDGQGKGSARGLDGLNLLAHMRRHEDLFTKLGGHKGAAGFSLLRQDVRFLSRALSEEMPQEALRHTKRGDLIDWEGLADQFTPDVLGELRRLEPFGHGFERPRFMIGGTVAHVRRIGGDQSHLTLTFKETPTKILAFKHGFLASSLEVGEPLRMVAQLEWNTFRGQTTPQWTLDAMLVATRDPDWKPKVQFTAAPSNLTGKVIQIGVGAGAASEWPGTDLGQMSLLEEAARRGYLKTLSIDMWRSWPSLRGWADHVVFLCHPPGPQWLRAASALLKPTGILWVDPALKREPVARKMSLLEMRRDRLARYWRHWVLGQPPLIAGRQIFHELGLDPTQKVEQRVPLERSVQYRLATMLTRDHRESWGYPITHWLELL